jgi:hypothetical protein
MENIEKEKSTTRVTKPKKGLTLGIVLLVFLSGAILVFLDWENYASVLSQADLLPVLGALALTVVSYVCVSSAFALVARLLGIHMRFRLLIEAGFVSIVMNHVLTTGGVAGYSVRYVLMRKHGVALKDVAAASILHFYITSLDMLSMLPVGFFYLYRNADLPAGITVLVGVMTLIMAVVALIATWLILVEERRRQVLDALTRIVRRTFHRDMEMSVRRFGNTLTRGVTELRRHPLTLLLVVALTWIDWLASVGVVWLCFDALGEPMRFGVILSGYVIGVMAGVLSLLPGGIGVQEGSMAGVFTLLGASFQHALLASILFRGIFFLLPYGVSLPVYGRLLRQDKSKV